jgi:hypothetical protein
MPGKVSAEIPPRDGNVPAHRISSISSKKSKKELNRVRFEK